MAPLGQTLQKHVMHMGKSRHNKYDYIFRHEVCKDVPYEREACPAGGVLKCTCHPAEMEVKYLLTSPGIGICARSCFYQYQSHETYRASSL